jgi:protein TonB
MREAQAQPFIPFSHCLMESDPETAREERRRRQRSLIFSVLVQAGLVTAAVVAPLFATGKLPLMVNDPPIPVPRGVVRIADPPPPDETQKRSGPQKLRRSDLMIAPPTIPPTIAMTDDRPPGITPDSSGEGPSIGHPDGADGAPQLFFEKPRVLHGPPQPPRESKPIMVRVSQPVQAARLIHRVEPRYPPLMRQVQRSGRVELRASIARDGTVRELEVVSGDAGFVAHALEAVAQWRYQPTLLNGEPVEVETRITVIFTLRAP